MLRGGDGGGRLCLPYPPLVDDGNRTFAAGLLGDEREVNAIAALLALGRRDEAEARARRFLDDHPKSALSERVRRNARL